MHQVAVHVDEAAGVGIINQVLLPDLQGGRGGDACQGGGEV